MAPATTSRLGSTELKRLKGNQPATAEAATRIPYFCPGCPHNSSTVVPEGSRAYAGIGCHYMAHWMDRNTEGLHPDGRRGRQLDRRGALLQDASTCSRISATAPTSTPAAWRSAPRARPAST